MKNSRKGREFALQCLYSMEVGQAQMEDVESSILQGLKASTEALSYGKRLVATVLENVHSLDDEILSISRQWPLNRLTIIDKMLLRCSLAEVSYFGDIPWKVSITEAVQLAKKYSGQESSQFVNGVLDAAMKKRGLPEEKD